MLRSTRRSARPDALDGATRRRRGASPGDERAGGEERGGGEPEDEGGLFDGPAGGEQCAEADDVGWAWAGECFGDEDQQPE